MGLSDDIKKMVMQAMKDKDEVKKTILRVALGEIQTIEARSGKISEEEIQKTLRKLITSNQETIEASGDKDTSVLKQEIEILDALLPKLWGQAEIVKFFQENPDALEELKAANNDGQATGTAMKHLKAQQAPVNGKDVSAAVRELRA